MAIDPEREDCVSMSPDCEGYVYFVRCPLNGYIKIGYSWENPESRFRAIVISSPVPVERFAIMEGSKRTELDYHGRFAEYRDHAEWFKPSQELDTLIAQEAEEWFPGRLPLPRKRKRYVLMEKPPREKPPKRRRPRFGPLQALLDQLAADKEPAP
jgi:hypothetical protein